MESTELTCIACPKGCRMHVTITDGVIDVQGSGCMRGKEYAKSEILNPMRMVTTSVKTRRAGHALLSVRTASPVPKGKVPEVLHELHRMKVKAPITTGEVVCRDVAGTKVDVIATKTIGRARRNGRLRRLNPFKHLRRRRQARKAAD